MLSVRIPQSGGREELGRGVFGGIRPEIGVGTSAIRYRVVEPVQPTVVSRTDRLPVSGTSEPALVPN